MSTTKLEIIDLSKFKSENLPELQGKKESIAELIKNNPIKDVTDNSSYEDMKKSRTAVKTLRTGLENEKKDVIRKIKTVVIDAVGNEYDLLITDVRSEENQRQEKVTIWEDFKEKERQDKLHLEEQRIANIKKNIGEFRQKWENRVSELQFSDIQNLQDAYLASVMEFDRKSLEEYDVLFLQSIDYLDGIIKNKTATLQEQEQIRIDNLVIADKQIEQNFIWNFQKEWNSSINNLKFENVENVKDAFKKSFKIEFKYFKDEFNDVFNNILSQLNSKSEFLLKAEEQRLISEKQKKEADKLAKEKFDFEEKQKESIYNSRKNQLEKLGFWNIFTESGTMSEEGIRLNLLAFEDTEFKNYLEVIRKSTESKENLISKEKVGFSGVNYEYTPILESEDLPIKNKQITQQEFENNNNLENGSSWHETTSKETESNFNALAEKFIPTLEVDFEENFVSIFLEYKEQMFADEYDSTELFVQWLNDNYSTPTKK